MYNIWNNIIGNIRFMFDINVCVFSKYPWFFLVLFEYFMISCWKIQWRNSMFTFVLYIRIHNLYYLFKNPTGDSPRSCGRTILPCWHKRTHIHTCLHTHDHTITIITIIYHQIVVIYIYHCIYMVATIFERKLQL